ncbi:MAG: hypothetical protein K2X44_06905, partial [Magnetospirillum sp.]|nr:hypothetical protein [Magnetospirillum sp.]
LGYRTGETAMDYRLHDIYQLAEILEAESNGRPFDRAQGQHLALTLAEHQPEIGNSMRLIAERLKQGERRS